MLDGEVEIRLGDRVLERAGPGSIVGGMALISDHQRTASAVAATDCRLAQINERRFLFLVQKPPFLVLHVMRVLADRIRRRDARLAPAVRCGPGGRSALFPGGGAVQPTAPQAGAVPRRRSLSASHSTHSGAVLR